MPLQQLLLMMMTTSPGHRTAAAHPSQPIESVPGGSHRCESEKQILGPGEKSWPVPVRSLISRKRAILLVPETHYTTPLDQRVCIYCRWRRSRRKDGPRRNEMRQSRVIGVLGQKFIGAPVITTIHDPGWVAYILDLPLIVPKTTNWKRKDPSSSLFVAYFDFICWAFLRVSQGLDLFIRNWAMPRHACQPHDIVVDMICQTTDMGHMQECVDGK